MREGQWLSWDGTQSNEIETVLIGTQPGNPSHIRTLCSQPLVPMKLPMPCLDASGSVGTWRLRIRTDGNDMATAVKVYYNGVFWAPTPRTSYIASGIQAYEPDDNNRLKWNEFLGYGSTNRVTSDAEVQAQVSMGVYFGGGGGNQDFTLEWPAEPDVDHTLALQAWPVREHPDGSFRCRVSLTLIPAVASGWPTFGTVAPF
jgi:hypothetical protein